jgi:D-3-phosphoglycerate dehydrogenase / 2-oxoglutarate reductase
MKHRQGRQRIVLFSEVVRHTRQTLEPLEQRGFDLIDRTDLGALSSHDQLAEALSGAWGTVAGAERYSDILLRSASALRVIARAGAGYDSIDIASATEHGIAVLTTPGANSESVADFTLALILGCLRDTLAADEAVRSGTWRRPNLARDLFKSTVGIVGFGQIGQAVARRLRAFDCRILVVEPFPDLDSCRDLGVDLVTLSEALPVVDVLTIHVPLTQANHHIIGDRELRLMQPHSILINTARGAVVDETALVSALNEGVIAGAGLDVFEREPLPTDHELTRLRNVVLAGHVASFTEGAFRRMMRDVVSGILAVADGQAPVGCINPTAIRRGRETRQQVGGRRTRST